MILLCLSFKQVGIVPCSWLNCFGLTYFKAKKQYYQGDTGAHCPDNKINHLCATHFPRQTR